MRSYQFYIIDGKNPAKFMAEDSHEPYDEKLFIAASEGNSEAFEKLCVLLVPEILEMARVQCRKRGLSSDVAPDIAQESILRAISTAQSRGLKGLTKGFFFIITKNIALDFAKKKHAISNQDTYIDSITSAGTSTEDSAAINEAFLLLSDKDQYIIKMMLIQNCGAKEIAENLGMTVASVYKRYERSLSKMRAFLE